MDPITNHCQPLIFHETHILRSADIVVRLKPLAVQQGYNEMEDKDEEQ